MKKRKIFFHKTKRLSDRTGVLFDLIFLDQRVPQMFRAVDRVEKAAVHQNDRAAEMLIKAHAAFPLAVFLRAARIAGVGVTLGASTCGHVYRVRFAAGNHRKRSGNMAPKGTGRNI